MYQLNNSNIFRPIIFINLWMYQKLAKGGWDEIILIVHLKTLCNNCHLSDVCV